MGESEIARAVYAGRRTWDAKQLNGKLKESRGSVSGDIDGIQIKTLTLTNR